MAPASIAARNLQNAVEKFIASGGSANAVTYDIILSYFQPEAEYHHLACSLWHPT